MDTSVAIVECKDYTWENVNSAIRRGIRLTEGFSSLFKRNERVLLKPNMLSPSAPERCAITHPEVFCAVGKSFWSRNLCSPPMEIHPDLVIRKKETVIAIP